MVGMDVPIDFSLCLVCQSRKEEELVTNPTSYKTLYETISIRASYNEQKYVEVWAYIKGFSSEDLKVRSATWHRTCYQDATHSGMVKRARDRYEREMAGPDLKRKRAILSPATQLTRSKTTPYNRDVCFFCEKVAGYRETLRTVSTKSAGKSLHDAIEISSNDKLRVKLSTAVDLKDAHAIDIKYHKKCWGNNVSTVLRKSSTDTSSNSAATAEIAAKIEFLTTTEIALRNGNILTMSEQEATHENILKENGVEMKTQSRKSLKQLLLSEIDDIEFHRPKRVNESEMVTIKQTRDAAVQLSEHDSDVSDDMKTLYDAALFLRKSINKSKNWVFQGSLENLSSEHYPQELYCFFRWLINGTSNANISTEKKRNEVHKRAMSLVQSTVSLSLTERQIANRKSEFLKTSREMPQNLAVGLAVHQSVRSKKLVDLLHGFGMSVEYNRLLRVESQIEASVLKRMENDDGLFLPPDIVKGRHIFFAIDNVDFAEDTYDGRNTLHGTAMQIYQKCQDEDEKPQIRLNPEEARIGRCINDLPQSVIHLLECPNPPAKPPSPTYPRFGLFTEDEIPITLRSEEYAWLLMRSISRKQHTDDALVQQEETPQSKIPVWSAYNSLVTKVMAVTRVGAPPLIAAPAHEWNTLLTVLTQAQGINAKIVGPQRKTIITLDLGLYMPAKKLQMSRNDLSNIILRPGELHIVMAQLKTIGAYIENSGIDMAWVESDLYGPTTVRQILEGNLVKRAESAHIVTLQSLFNLYEEAFLESQEASQCKDNLIQLVKQLEEACLNGKKDEITKAHRRTLDAVESMEIVNKMVEFDKSYTSNPMFKVFRQYMSMVLEMMMFIRAIRTGNWKLHLQALEIFTKYFFVHDRLNYSRMVPLYLAEMKSLQQTDSEIYSEFQQGNWVVNKNSSTSFCGLGADNALEHINRSMKVTGGLVGITLNPSASTKFFFIAPELARLTEQAKEMSGVSTKNQQHHHNLTAAVLSREEKCVNKLTATIASYTNPFSQPGDDLFNLVTKEVMPEEVKRDLCAQSTEGEKLLKAFVSERIQKGDANLWSKMKKRKLLTWKSTCKKTKVTVNNEVVELKEDRCLFARLMMVCQSRPEVNLQEAIGKYEFSVVPRALFAADGTMLHCSNKSVLMNLIENEVAATSPDDAPTAGPRKKVVIVDGMAELQALHKPADITTCAELAEHFTNTVLQKYSANEEMHLVFDRYDVDMSLKSKTRERRQGSQVPIYLRITDTTHISKMSMKRLLSHSNTKKELTEYLSAKVLKTAEDRGQRFIVAWGSCCEATHRDVSHIRSSQEEADTKIILHAIDATIHGATEIHIHSPDTDVFILALRRYPELCDDVKFTTGTGQRHRVIKLKPINQALGISKVAALPGLHALSGADITGSFANKGKITWWKIFKGADQECINALVSLGTREPPTEDTMASIEKLVCQVYLPKTTIASVHELRWCLFKKKQAQSENLPPTQEALRQAILRANYQALIWNQDTVPDPQLPSPEAFGWTLEDEKFVPVMTTLPPAPEAVTQLVKCGCTKSRCSSNRCSCRKAQLNCTDLCSCSDSDELCDNTQEDDDAEEDDDDSDASMYSFNESDSDSDN